MKPTYEELMAEAPPQHSPEFVDFLRQRNVVVFETEQWIVVENFKYHTVVRPWLTAFWKGHSCDWDTKNTPCPSWWEDVDQLWHHEDWSEWEWRKHPTSFQTVPGRLHIHLIKYHP